MGQLGPLPQSPTVSVIVPARDDADGLPAAVASALEQQVPGSLEVIVAVGPSRDGTETVAASLADSSPAVKVVANPWGLTSAALNAAIAASSGEVVVRLDAHAVLPPGYIARAIEILRDTGAVNVGGRQVPVADEGFARAVAHAMRSPVGSGGATYRSGARPGVVDTVYLGVFRRPALDQVGGFDETLVRNQDYELNHRLRRAGGVVFFHPDLAVEYRPRDTVGALWRQYFQYGAWKRRVLRRFPGSVRLRQLVAPTLVLALVVGAVLALTWSPWPLVGLVTAWIFVLLAGACASARSLAATPPVAVALAVMHLAWGVGFLIGRATASRPPPEP
ncbi:MAG: glycosyltransferase family 2 protein [Actinobacteria bacterium]|nr:glycosyltransferase family 2 protein [Actinomycetota bacterium]